MEDSASDKRLYLRLGDRVTHVRYEEWGEGAVVEERTSIVPGGTCLVRLLFEDGQQRTFNNDLDHEQCCYFFGLRKIHSFDPFEARENSSPGETRARRRATAVDDQRDEVVEVRASAARAKRTRTTPRLVPPRRRLPGK
jgi:hypothetical protein